MLDDQVDQCNPLTRWILGSTLTRLIQEKRYFSKPLNPSQTNQYRANFEETVSLYTYIYVHMYILCIDAYQTWIKLLIDRLFSYMYNIVN